MYGLNELQLPKFEALTSNVIVFGEKAQLIEVK